MRRKSVFHFTQIGFTDASTRCSTSPGQFEIVASTFACIKHQTYERFAAYFKISVLEGRDIFLGVAMKSIRLLYTPFN